MALAHVCTGCGSSLTRVRVVLDREYNLPVVTCPTCSRSCVRRRHPLVARSRAHMRLRRSLQQLIALPLLLALLLAGSIWASFLTLDLLRALRTDWISLIPDLVTGRARAWTLPEWLRGSGEVYSPLILLFTTTSAGVLCGFALTHWRRTLRPLAWLGAWNAVLTLPFVVVAFDRFLCDAIGADSRSRPLNLDDGFTNGVWHSATASVISLPFFIVGLGLARTLTRVSARNASRRWKKRRRSLRRLRESR